MIELRTLGSLGLKRSDADVGSSILSQPKRFALLVYLALSLSRGFQRRDTLLGLFWPEQDAEHARAALRQALSVLRRALEKEALVTRGSEDVGVNPAFLRCDATEFEAELDRGQPEQALELYRGDLLPGFFISEAPQFERWLDDERSRLRQRAAVAAWELAEQNEASGDCGEAKRRIKPGAGACTRGRGAAAESN